MNDLNALVAKARRLGLVDVDVMMLTDSGLDTMIANERRGGNARLAEALRRIRAQRDLGCTAADRAVRNLTRELAAASPLSPRHDLRQMLFEDTTFDAVRNTIERMPNTQIDGLHAWMMRVGDITMAGALRQAQNRKAAP